MRSGSGAKTLTICQADIKVSKPINLNESEHRVGSSQDFALSWDSLLEALPDGTALLDEHGTFMRVNGVLCELTGFTREELVGQNVQMLVPSRHRDTEYVARREYARDPNTKIIWSDMDLSVLCRDGSEISVDFALSPISVEGRAWVVASIRDNRAQREVETAHAEAELRFRVAFEDNMAPMMFTDLDDRTIAVNDAFCEMVGYSREELLGQDSKIFTYPEDIGITEETLRRVNSGEADQVRYVKRYLHKDGRVLVVEVSRSRRATPREDPLLRLLRARYHRGTGAQRPVVPSGTPRLLDGPGEQGTVRGPPDPSACGGSSPRRTGSRVDAGPR